MQRKLNEEFTFPFKTFENYSKGILSDANNFGGLYTLPNTDKELFNYFIFQATFDGNGLKFHVECATKYKTAYPLWFGPLRSALVLCHPDSIKTVLSSHTPKEEFVYSLVVPFTGEDIKK